MEFAKLTSVLALKKMLHSGRLFSPSLLAVAATNFSLRAVAIRCQQMEVILGE